MILRVHPDNPEPRKIQQAVEILRQGGVIAYPTGTVIGFGCDLMSKRAVEKLHLIKGAKKDKRFSFLCADLSEISRYAHVSDAAYRIMKRLVPGPYTFVLAATREVPRRLQHPRRKTIGLRVPDHPIPQALLAELNEPLMSSTLILPGQRLPLSDPEEIRRRLEHQVDLVIDGGHCGLEPTTVVVLEDGTWGLVRASSNKPELVIVVESPTSEANMRAIFADIDGLISAKFPEVGPYNQKI